MDKFDPWNMIDFFKETYRAEYILCQANKAPLYVGWQAESRTVDEMREHVANGGALGLKIPCGVICLDLDKPTGKEWVENHKAELPYYQVTKNGFHIFFKAPKERPSGKRTPAGIEITYRFHGSNQINVAPSPGKTWVVNHFGDLPELPDELNTGKTSKFVKENKGFGSLEKPIDSSTVHYLSLYGLHIPIYLESRPRMPMGQSICCRKMTWRIAHTKKGERNQTRLECGNLAGSYLIGKSLSFQELRWIAFIVGKYSETPQKAVREFFQGANNSLAQGVARTYGIDRKRLAGVLRDLVQGEDLAGVYVTNETLRTLGFAPSRSLGKATQKWIDGKNVRVRMITDLVTIDELLLTTGENMEPKRASETSGLLQTKGEKCAI